MSEGSARPSSNVVMLSGQPSEALQTDIGGDTFDDMSEVDAKIAAAEARTDTKFAELLGEMRLMNTRLDHVEKTTTGLRGTVIATGLGVVAIVIAVMAYGGQLFNNGLSAQAIVTSAVTSAISSTQPHLDALDSQSRILNTKVDQINSKFDTLLQAVQKDSKQ